MEPQLQLDELSWIATNYEGDEIKRNHEGEIGEEAEHFQDLSELLDKEIKPIASPLEDEIQIDESKTKEGRNVDKDQGEEIFSETKERSFHKIKVEKEAKRKRRRERRPTHQRIVKPPQVKEKPLRKSTGKKHQSTSVKVSNPRRKREKGPKPIPVHEIDRMFRNYRRIQYKCGPKCKCYYCVLLNVSSGDEDSELDERDTLALAYGFGENALERNKRRSKIPKRLQHSPSKLSLSPKEVHPAQDGDGLGIRAVHHHQHRRANPPLLRGVPSFVRKFERVLYETRQESMRDSILDSIIDFFGWLLKNIYGTCLNACKLYRGRKKVSPALPIVMGSQSGHLEFGDCDLLSIAIVKDKVF